MNTESPGPACLLKTMIGPSIGGLRGMSNLRPSAAWISRDMVRNHHDNRW